MCQVFKPISISLSPNTEKDDIRLALKLLFQPWRWRKQKTKSNCNFLAYARKLQFDRSLNTPDILENEFKKYFGTKYAFSFNSGRSAFMAILRSLQKEGNASSEAPSDSEERRGMGGEVLLQAFTCNAAVNPILWSGLKPVFVDCNEQDFNIDIEDLKQKITPQSRIVVVQHTFGLPANMDEIIKICEQGNLILIEDCAHSLGAKYSPRWLPELTSKKSDKNCICKKSQINEQKQKIGLPAEAPRSGAKVGTFGKAAFFSFSRDKIISSVYGGIVITDDNALAEKIKKFQQECKYPSFFWIFQQLLHPVFLNYIILPIYNFIDLGKIFLIFSQCLHILSKAVHWKEKRGKKPDYFPKRLPNALAILALHQFKKIERFNQHRKKIAEFYYKELSAFAKGYGGSSEARFPASEGGKNTPFILPPEFPERENVFLRFTIKHKKAHDIIWEAWNKQNILIGDWYTSPIAPDDTQLDKVGYRLGACPKAEKLAKITFNLPTHINIGQKEAERIVKFLEKWK